jgi:hypothetical protein
MTPELFAGEIARQARSELADVETSERREALYEAIYKLREMMEEIEEID